MTVALIAVIAVALAVAYVLRDDQFVSNLAVAVAMLPVPAITSRFVTFRRGFIWPTLVTSTVWRYRTIRMSFAYLFRVAVDGEQLLIRGERIATQYQPVGGVFKARAEGTEYLASLGVVSDTRFAADDVNRNDLRINVPGRRVHDVLRWFDSGEQREVLPWREFVEELVTPGLLDRNTFEWIDCSYRGRRRLPFRFDTYSQHYQLIIGDVYELHPTEEQLAALRALRDRVRGKPDPPIIFATPEQIERSGAVPGGSARYDIPPTARWLVTSG